MSAETGRRPVRARATAAGAGLGLGFLLLPSALSAGSQELHKDRIFRNEKAGYSLAYPASWFPSGIDYGNAFELRSYQPGQAHLLPESERASLTVVETPVSSAAEASAFLESSVKGLLASEFSRLDIDGRRAVRVRRRVPPQLLGPGASRGREGSEHRASATRFHYVATFIADGRRLILMEAVASEGATAGTLDEILQIEGSLRFDAARDPERP